MKMYHSTMRNAIDTILRDGLKTGRPGISKRAETGGGYTMAGNWADEHYETRPVYLAMRQGLYGQLHRQLGLEVEVEVDPKTLVADLPSLVDSGAYIVEDGVYWEYDDIPPTMKKVTDGDGFVSFDELLVPGGPAANAAIHTTGTAASPADIPVERITRLTDESVLREYIKDVLAEINLGSGRGIDYTAFVLDDGATKELLQYVPPGWTPKSHHMTLISPHYQGSRAPSHWLDFADDTGQMKVVALAQNDKVVTGLVDLGGLPIPMKGPTFAHVTIATNPPNGKAWMSNDFTEADFEGGDIPHISLTGHVEEILR